MQAAQSNPTDQALTESGLGSWSEMGLIALPSPTSLVPGSLALARAVTVQQQDTLGKLSSWLGQLEELATRAKEPHATADERKDLHQRFHSLSSSMQGLARNGFQGCSLFDRRDWTVDLEPPGNKLVIPGVHRAAEGITALEQADLLSTRTAEESLQRVAALRQTVALDQSLVAQIRSRLEFASTLASA